MQFGAVADIYMDKKSYEILISGDLYKRLLT